jgi:DNA-binding transcriptional regulator PaaX
MKKNTQKILLALFSETDQVVNRVSLENIQSLVPELSGGGFRSLLYILKQQGMIQTDRVLGVTSISMTQYGSKLLIKQFPALSSHWDTWQGNWECMIFLDSPAFDKQFRYLRKLLISEGAMVINRGVYLAPGGFSTEIIEECNKSYYKHVIIFSVADWKIGIEASTIIEKYGLLDIAESYSGLSNDVNRLIETLKDKKRLTKSDKRQIHMVYDRLHQILLEDPGFCTFYFKEVKNIKNILKKLNSIIAL